jgi:hypothetical protein
MDKSQLLTIVITAVITAVIKELVTFAAKHSPKLTATLKKIATTVLRKHWRMVPILYDLLIIVFGFWFLASAINDKTPATKGFAALCSMMVLTLVDRLKELPEHALAYRNALRSTAANKALQATAAAPSSSKPS